MINFKISPKIGFVTAGYLSIVGTSTFAGGFDLPDQDAFAVARGLAVVATADNPAAIFYNPAGLTQLTGNNLEAGFYGIYLDPQYTPPGGGNTFHNQEPFGGVPQLFYVHGNEKQTFSYGLGVYAPSGLSVRWPNQPYDQFRFQGDGWGLSGNVGLLWKPLEQLSFGASLHTGTKINLKGYTSAYNNQLGIPGYPEFSTSASAQADFQFPLKAEAGFSYRPTPKWNLEFDVDYTDWNSMGTVNIQQAHGVPGLFPQNIALPLEWKSSWYYELGATRYFDNGWHVSAGYIFNQNAVPDANYNTVVADENRHFFSVGVGHKGKQLDFDVAYQFGYGPDRTVNGSVNPAANGTYGFFSHAVAVSVGWHF